MTRDFHHSQPRFLIKARRTVALVISLILGIFFAFVGYMKAFAPIVELAQHNAWTVHLPVALGRLIGWSEIACAALLLVCPWRAEARKFWLAGAALLFANQIAAAAVHFARDELQSLPQNAAIISGCIFIILAAERKREQVTRGSGEKR